MRMFIAGAITALISAAMGALIVLFLSGGMNGKSYAAIGAATIPPNSLSASYILDGDELITCTTNHGGSSRCTRAALPQDDLRDVNGP